MEIVLGIATILAGLVGVYLGFVLSESSSKRREQETLSRQNEAVKTLIDLEVKLNLEELETYWDGFSSAKKVIQDSHSSKSVVAEKLASDTGTEHVPALRSTIWESQLSHLPLAYSKDEVRTTAEFYYQMESLIEMIENIRHQVSLRDKSVSYEVYMERFEEAIIETIAAGKKLIEG